ncbi:pyrroloquinoline quinone biosynthesis protein PqqB [Siccirubricoccus sp. KC 17139]|uniref:Coenzyme PQQ synthesis protein B n=1 Tax=Siccirubricoccus soli TaxID=2899147 RepID=A0ABT1D3B3_9PROT|nr:pyrroloquinoline quinone biosynthesis protein PqqB [Siccirubricoccus soli]MCO6416422.1 pyrroloquinoline quinone biosynthesis protein PqqB [Siccirubricoccus soli]MCP2682556.1 pyrroloquinoline quinone biosynthesis protein PqqB [Siccirubricoccus soli]
MRAIILGAAAGGGFPQWNSAGPACRRARLGDPAARPRTQASVAVSADGERWVLLNASPDLRAQIEATPALHPRPGPGVLRHSPIAAVALTGAEIDTVTGLLTLRERHAFSLYAAAPVLQVLAENPIFGALDRALVKRLTLPLGRAEALVGSGGEPLGLMLEAFIVPGKVPLFQERDGADPGRAEAGETVGLALSAGGATLFFIPGCRAMTPALAARLEGADCVLFDGTLWRDDEMIRTGAGQKTGRRMGHMSIDGPEGVLAAFARLGVRRRILIHLNNTNPVLLADSEERAAVEAAGWEVAEDGMEIAL